MVLSHGPRAWRRARGPHGVVAFAVALSLVGAMVGVASGQTTDVTANATSYTFVSVVPNRILDTRYNNGLSGPLKNRTPRSFQVTDRWPSDATRNVPAAAVAVSGNLTV